MFHAGLFDCPWQLAVAELPLFADSDPTAQIIWTEAAGPSDCRHQEPLQEAHEIAKLPLTLAVASIAVES